MAELFDLPVFAPIPFGHRVSIVPLETELSPLFGGPATWRAMSIPLVCDENTRVVYTDRCVMLHPESSYERILFKDATTRISQSLPIKRGVVLSCSAMVDHGDTVQFHTLLRVDTGPQLT